MPVGNDVVDLRDPGSQPTAIHPRFDSRVFTRGERRLLDEASPADRHALRWILWAAKESVFKLVRQQDDSIPFHPRAFETRLTGEHSAVVVFGGSAFPVSLDVTEERVHAVSMLDAGTRPLSGIGQPARCPVGREASRLVREEAARAVGEKLGIDAREVEIEGRIPRATRKGRRLPVDISLSHHGRFLAHAILGLVLVITGCSSPTGPRHELSEAQGRWVASGVDSYVFEYDQACFCAFLGPARITVEAGVVVGVETLPGGPVPTPPLEAFPTITDLFEWLNQAADEDPVMFDVTYDRSLGYPVSASVDVSLEIVDEEFSFQVSNLVAAN